MSIALRLFVSVFVFICHLPAPPPAPPRVVVITLDTTRADHIGAYGAARVSTPVLDALAADSVVFEQAATVAPLTLTAHATIFTGLLPPHHGVRDNASPPLRTDCETLATALHARGFGTAAFVGSSVLGATRGLARGFESYDDRMAPDASAGKFRRRAGAVVDDAIQWVQRQGRGPFLLWVHLYDAHEPYDTPEQYSLLYREDAYSGAIAYMDSQIGRLLHELDRRRLLNGTIVVVAGDHGEALGERGERGHGLSLYENTLRVPLIVAAPGMRGRRVADAVSLADVMPTVLDLLGIRAPAADGVTLVPLMKGRPGVAPGVYAETMYPLRFGRAPLRSTRDDRFKLIESADRTELYDLQRDPAEQHDLAPLRPSLVHAMAAHIAGIQRDERRPNIESSPTQTRAALAALGYIGSSAGTDRTGRR